MIDNRRVLISIFLIAFVVRLLAAIFYLNFDSHALTMHRPFLPFKEGSNDILRIRRIIGNRDRYNTSAHDIFVHHTFRRTQGRAPLYPIFLAICYSVLGCNIFAFFIPQITLASINAILIFFLIQRLFNNKIGIMASLFYAFNPHFILFSIQLYAETLYFFLLLSLLLLCQKLLMKPSRKYAAGVGICMALTALCRAVFLAFVPFIFIWLIIVFFRQKRKILLLLFTVLTSFSLVYGIWVVRDYRAISREIIFSVSKTAWEAKKNSDLNKDKISNGICKDSITAEVIPFINWIKENPKQYFKRCVTQLKIFLFMPYAEGVSLRHKIVSSLIFFTIYPLGYLGIAKAAGEKKDIALLALLFIGSMTIFHTFHFSTLLDGELRYRLPAELFITIFAAYGVSALTDFLHSSRIIINSGSRPDQKK
jgi:hypothetical protein